MRYARGRFCRAAIRSVATRGVTRSSEPRLYTPVVIIITVILLTRDDICEWERERNRSGRRRFRRDRAFDLSVMG